jgi:peroxiredoxin Q/BCP
MAKLEVGKKAPAFTAIIADGKKVKLGDISGKNGLVLYFYPKDNTPGARLRLVTFVIIWMQLKSSATR